MGQKPPESGEPLSLPRTVLVNNRNINDHEYMPVTGIYSWQTYFHNT